MVVLYNRYSKVAMSGNWAGPQHSGRSNGPCALLLRVDCVGKETLSAVIVFFWRKGVIHKRRI